MNWESTPKVMLEATKRLADHFCWDENFTLILGTSPIGRATVDRLKLNRTGVVNLRKVLVERGEHPLKWS